MTNEKLFSCKVMRITENVTIFLLFNYEFSETSHQFDCEPMLAI